MVFGILIALQINNWNSNRILKQKELLNLIAIRNSLESDLKTELIPSIEFYNMLAKKVDYVENILLANPSSVSDSIALEIGDALMNEWYFMFQTAAFENITSIGIDIISNDSLRSLITGLYNYQYQFIANMSADLDDYYNEHISPFINQHFIGEGLGYRKWRLYPRNSNANLENENIHTLLWQLKQWRENKKSSARIAANRVERLIDQLDKEIARIKD